MQIVAAVPAKSRRYWTEKKIQFPAAIRLRRKRKKLGRRLLGDDDFIIVKNGFRPGH